MNLGFKQALMCPVTRSFFIFAYIREFCVKPIVLEGTVGYLVQLGVYVGYLMIILMIYSSALKGAFWL